MMLYNQVQTYSKDGTNDIVLRDSQVRSLGTELYSIKMYDQKEIDIDLINDIRY